MLRSTSALVATRSRYIRETCRFLIPKIASPESLAQSSEKFVGKRRRGLKTRRLFSEDGADSLSIELQSESVFFRKFADLFLPAFLVYRPQARQVFLVNDAVRPLKFTFDVIGKRFRNKIIGANPGFGWTSFAFL